MAFPVAAVAVALWNDYPDFGDLLLAHFRRTCPYILPVFLPRLQGQTSEEYYKSLGYKYTDDTVVEKQDKYLTRMSGLMRLYTSIIVTRQRHGVDAPHPHGIQNAWRWLAVTLNAGMASSYYYQYLFIYLFTESDTCNQRYNIIILRMIMSNDNKILFIILIVNTVESGLSECVS